MIDKDQVSIHDRFRFAIGRNNKLVDVMDIDRSDRYALGDFFCISCNSSMVAALPKQRKRYFRHKGARPTNCSNESYLHSAAKYMISDAISWSIQNRKPYHLSISTPIICERYFEDFGIRCDHQNQSHQYDLTQIFDLVDVEGQVEEFSADVLLQSTLKPTEKLLIEIAVTHPCSKEKIESGNRIVELTIKSEDDIKKFQAGIDLTLENVRHYNLKKPKPKYSICEETCSWIAKALFIHETGEATIEVFDVAYLASRARSSGIRYSRYLGRAQDYMEQPNSWDNYVRDCTLEVVMEKSDLKSCAICKHVSLNHNKVPFYCNLQRKPEQPSDANQCSDFSCIIE